VQRRLNWTVIKASIVDSLTGTATIFLIATGGVLLSRFMAFSRLPAFMGNWIGEYAVNPLLLIVMISLVYLFLGCLLDSIGIMLLTLPILLPMLDAAKVDLIWFGVLVIKLLEIGLITPPVGMNVFVIKSVVGDAISLERIFKGITWFVITDIVTLGILILFPQISLLIPKLMG
jgi:TRAP-type C4-dicarboxylate transport system permease large subunit